MPRSIKLPIWEFSMARVYAQCYEGDEMPHDSIGNVIEVGDRVKMIFVVKDINQAVERCNVTLEAIDSAGLGEYKPVVAVNARLTRRIDKGESNV